MVLLRELRTGNSLKDRWLGEAVPALQGCLQSREEAGTKVDIWRACTASAGLRQFSVPSSQFSVLRETLVPRFYGFIEN
jgi:hypothetical protein